MRAARLWTSIVMFSGLSTLSAAPTSPPAVPLITQSIDTSQRVLLAGNTNSNVVTGTNLGTVAADFPVAHMMLLMQRSPAREQALETFIDQLHNKASPNFHQWITATQFGTLFGPAKQDVDTVTSWLESNGFTVGTIYPSGTMIDFSGTAGQIQQTFRTQMANFNVGGTTYLSNVSDPSIPLALAGVVQGVASLNNYFPRPQVQLYSGDRWSSARNGRGTNSLSQYLGLSDFTFTDSSGTEFFVAPADFNAIY